MPITTARARCCFTTFDKLASSAGAGMTVNWSARVKIFSPLPCSFSVTMMVSAMKRGVFQHHAATMPNEQCVNAAGDETETLADAPFQLLCVHRHHVNASSDAMPLASRQDFSLRGQDFRMLQLAGQRHGSRKVVGPNEGGVQTRGGKNRIGGHNGFVVLKH